MPFKWLWTLRHRQEDPNQIDLKVESKNTICVPYSAGSGQDPVRNFYEDSMKYSSFIEGGKFLDNLRDVRFSKNSALLSEQI
jgi:hypothetical protein